MGKIIIGTLIILLVVTASGYAVLLNPSIQENVGFQLNKWYVQVNTILRPPQRVSFSSSSSSEMGVELNEDPNNLREAISEDTAEEIVETEPEFAPIPQTFAIEGGTYYDQHFRWNYCGPSSLATLLSYWDVERDRDEVAHAMRTNTKDKNINPHEMVDYVKEETGLDALMRVGGDLEVLKRLIAAGYPVIVEKGPEFLDIHNKITWMGHYQVMTGYNDHEGYFIAQDPYIEPDYEQAYDVLIDEWRSFNYTYIVVYPSNEEQDVLDLLGEDADKTQNYHNALEKAQQEFYQTSGLEQFFSIYNYGTNLVYLQDYAGAAKAYDTAFELYDALPEELSTKPYRILWYQTGPFYAYYYTGRYQDVIEKATKNSIEMVRDDIPALEESWYWLGAAKIAIGETEEGIEDLLSCLEYQRFYPPCIQALNEQGIYP